MNMEGKDCRPHLFQYDWTLAGADFQRNEGKVFSCFACGGGSTMGYKLAGFDVIGCNEIDPRLMAAYKANHAPRYAYGEDIRVFKDRRDLPDELFCLDIPDGSPPCSTFSTAGQREKSWGKMKYFREGQSAQVLDTLFFDFIDLAARLRPKVVIAENVTGLLVGNAKIYVKKIYEEFDKAGYYCQHYVCDASRMGVPQRRKRIFFIALRRDLMHALPGGLFAPTLNMSFDEPVITLAEIADYKGKSVKNNSKKYKLWEARTPGDKDFGDISLRLYGNNINRDHILLRPGMVCPTITTKGSHVYYDRPIRMSEGEIMRASSWSSDYDFHGQPVLYVCGMCVPPVMMAQVAARVRDQWIRPLNTYRH